MVTRILVSARIAASGYVKIQTGNGRDPREITNGSDAAKLETIVPLGEWTANVKEVGMPDQVVIEGVGRKFQGWAESLSDEEQETLAEWLTQVRGEDVEAHWDADWWQQPEAWLSAWADIWARS